MFEERITEGTAPAVLAEHVARYRLAHPLALAAAVWVDLGCGEGLAAAEAFGEALPPAALLVDASEPALAEARRRLAACDPATLAADLATLGGVAAAGEAIGALGDDVCVTCFEVLEHLERFAPLVSLLARLATERGATVVLSTPNDAFTGTDNEFHRTRWGTAATEELRTVLPGEHVAFDQFALAGSGLAPANGGSSVAGAVAVDASRPASHHVLAFGPRASALGPLAEIVQHDPSAQRAWERRRDGDLAWFRQRVEDLEWYEREARRLGAELERARTKLDELGAADPPDRLTVEDAVGAEAAEAGSVEAAERSDA